MKYLFILILIVAFSSQLLAQEYLDEDSLSSCELFIKKKDFDKNARLERIKALRGKQVTVYLIKVKSKKIKSSFTGIVDTRQIDQNQLPLENLTSVLVVTEFREDNLEISHFPLTDDISYRIYLTDCMKK